MDLSPTVPNVEALAGDAPATLFRDFDGGSPGRPCLVREERPFDGNLTRLVHCLAETDGSSDCGYLIADDAGDFERDVVLAMRARADLGPLLARVAD